MKRLCSSLLLAFSLLSTVSIAQNVAPTWTAVHQGTGDNSDRFNKIIPDGAGNFIGVGYTVKSGNYRDFLTVKFNSNGDTLWWRTKNGKGNGDDEAVTVGTDASGNVFVAGYSDEDIKQDDIRLIKYDANGIVLWDTLWDSPASLDDVPVELKIDGGGNCIIGGIARPDTFTGSRDYITLKFDPNGIIIWSQQYSRPAVLNGKDEISAIALDANGDVYVTGRSFNGTDDDFLTIKYDGILGTELWTAPYNGGSDDRATDIVIDNAGNVIVVGQNNNGNNYDYRTIKYNNLGSIQWLKVYNAPANQDDIPSAVTVDAADNVYVTGESDIDQTALINFDFQTVKYSSTSTQLWVVRTGNAVPQNDEPKDIVVDATGNVYVTGRTDQNISQIASDNDYMTVMYNSSGSIQWGGNPVYHAGNHTAGDDVAYSMLLDGLGHLYVAGSALNDTTQKDATVVKYDAATGSVVWVKDFNGIGDFNESVKTIVVDANNNSYAAGYSFNENNNLDATLVKVDPAGVVVCTYKYQGIKGDDDEFNSLAISLNGNIYAAGYTKVTDQKSNFLLVKWDPSTCDTIWTWTYDYIGQTDKIESMVLDVAGNIFITGRSDANPVDTSDNDDIVTMKLDNNANVLWSQRFNGTGNLKDQPSKIIFDNAGDVLVCGRTENVHDDDFLVIKYNSSTGTPVWGTPVTFGGPFANDDRVNDIAVDANNNIFVAGYSQTASGNASQDPTVLKFDPSGGAFTSGAFSIGDDKDEAVKVAVDFNNNVYVLYKVDNDSGVALANNYDFVLRKYDNSLTEIWASPVYYDSPIHGDDVPEDLIISPSGDIYITGTSENDTLGGRVNNNWVTLGYDPSGVRIFISNFDLNADDDSPKALIIRGPSLWVCGYTQGLGQNQKDISVNNYILPVGINEINNSTSVTAFPNPFTNECSITLKNFDNKSSAVIEIFDMLGNSVANPQLMNGDTFTIKKGNLAAGIYEYRIRSNSSILAYGKLIIN